MKVSRGRAEAPGQRLQAAELEAGEFAFLFSCRCELGPASQPTSNDK